MAAKYPGNWNRKNSMVTASSWRECLDKYQNYINTAQSSDGLLIDQFNGIKPSLDLLMSDPRTIRKLLDAKNDVLGRLGPRALSDLQEIYSQLTNIQKSRKAALKAIDLKEADVDSYFLQQISSDGTLNVEAACQKLLDSFEPQINIIKKSIEDQSGFISTLMV